MRARCSNHRYCPDPLGIVTTLHNEALQCVPGAKQFVTALRPLGIVTAMHNETL